MDCSTATAGLLLLVTAVLALAAFLASRASTEKSTALAAEVERLRDLCYINAAAVARLAADVARLRAREAAEPPRVAAVPKVAAAPGEPGVAAGAPAVEALPVGPQPPVIPDLAASAGAAAGPPRAAIMVPTSGVAAMTAQSGPLPTSAVTAAGTPASGESGSRPPAAPRHTTFEELVGARLQVWIGAMALALAGAFLVKISFERGWISPPVRVAAGIAFGVAMLALADRLPRSSGRISEALAAAGIADLFACFLAAVHLYHLVPPAAGLLLMGLTTAVAVALALRQGIMVALIGLIGGFLTPALIQTGQPSARNLFGYLLLLIAGLLAVAWRRRWRWLAIAAVASGLLWATVWLAHPFHGGDAAWLSLFLIAVAAGAVLPPISAATAPRGAGVFHPAHELPHPGRKRIRTDKEVSDHDPSRHAGNDPR